MPKDNARLPDITFVITKVIIGSSKDDKSSVFVLIQYCLFKINEYLIKKEDNKRTIKVRPNSVRAEM